MQHIIYSQKATIRYRIVSYFVTKIKRLKIYQEKKYVEEYIEKVEKNGDNLDNFKENKKFKAKSKIETIANLKTIILNPKGENLIVYLHGGAYINRPTTFHMNFASKIALKTNSRVLVPYYPLAPFHNVTECLEALEKFVLLTDRRFVLLGDSAGAGLCFSLLYYLQENDLDYKVMSTVSVSPWLDMTTAGSYRKLKDRMLDKNAVKLISQKWKGDLWIKHPYCSPAFAEYRKPFDALIMVGGKEVLHKDTTLFVQQNRNQDILYLDYANMEHDFPLYPVPETKKAINQIVKYITETHKKH